MDCAIIANWNKHVTNRDVVYHLGDWSFYDPADYLHQLSGNIHLIFGNHDDKRARKTSEGFGSVHDMLYLRLNGYRIHLCHYKLEAWRSNYRGAWHLHGHSHGQLVYARGPQKALDVGIMNKGWNPDVCWLWSFEEIEKYMADKPNTQHHDMLEIEE